MGNFAWAFGLVLLPVALWLTYRFLFWLWKVIPDGRVKRLLFRSYYGTDTGPWAHADWQRKEARDRASAALVSRRDEGQGL